MRERLASLGLALAALALFWALWFPKPLPQASAAPRPVSTEASEVGYLGLARWLRAGHVPLLVLHGRFQRLDALRGLPSATGNLLVTTLPHALPVRAAELPSLEAWVRQGNTLLVMAALDDTPRWSLTTDRTLLAQVQVMTQLKIEQILPASGESAPQVGAAIAAALAPGASRLNPTVTTVGPHPQFARVSAVATYSELPAGRWRATPVDEAPLLALARRAGSDDGAVWLKASGAGRIIVSAFASPFSNRTLGQSDNARWFANIVAAALGPAGRVILDDAHQGVLDEYDADALFADPRLHRALGWIVLTWLLFVLGARRLAAASAGRAAVDDTAMLQLSAGFYAAALTEAAAGARLIEQFFNALRRRLGLREDGAPLWEWLEGHAGVARADLDELRRLQQRAVAGRRLDLRRLQRLLSDLTRQLL